MKINPFKAAEKAATLFLLILIGHQSCAQSPGLPGGDPDVPVDGGISLLIAAGVIYGVRKIRNGVRSNDPG